MYFKVLLMILALSIATVAAFFSITGIAKLFAGAFLPVVIMAAALEAGKLITASFLTRYWSKLTKPLRIYYSLATLVLVIITSVGIYGFLTAAYQVKSDELQVYDQQVSVLELKKNRYNEQIQMYIEERTQLTNTITELSTGLSNNIIQYKDPETGQIITTTSSATRRSLEAQLSDAKEQRDNAIIKIEELNDSITAIDIQKMELQLNTDVVSEAGPLRYLSKLTGWSMDRVVNVFALMIIFVFDPLAISLIIGFNYITTLPRVKEDPKEYKIYNDIEGTPKESELKTSEVLEVPVIESKNPVSVSEIVQPEEKIEVMVEEEKVEKNIVKPLDNSTTTILNLDDERDEYKCYSGAKHYPRGYL